MSRTSCYRLAVLVSVSTLLVLHGRPVLAETIGLHSLPLPPASRLGMVGDNIVHNGSAVSIATFDSDQGVDTVLEFYRQLWQSDDDTPGFVESELADWRVIARLEDNVNLALQLSADGSGGSTGLVSVLDLERAGRPVETLPMPAGTELLSTTSGNDGGRQADTWLLRSRARPGEISGFYIDTLEARGWQVVSDRSRMDPAVVLFTGEAGTVELTAASGSDGTFVVVNRVRTGS